MAGNDADGLLILVDGITEVLFKGPPSVTQVMSDHDPIHNAAMELGKSAGIIVPPDAFYHSLAKTLFGPSEGKFVDSLNRLKERVDTNEKDSKNDDAAK